MSKIPASDENKKQIVINIEMQLCHSYQKEFPFDFVLAGRRSGLMVSALDSRFELWLGYCIVFLGKILYFQSASCYPGV